MDKLHRYEIDEKNKADDDKSNQNIKSIQKTDTYVILIIGKFRIENIIINNKERVRQDDALSITLFNLVLKHVV